MADPQPRARPASTVADDAAMLLAELQDFTVGLTRLPGGPSQSVPVATMHRFAQMAERLAAQLEDLASVVDAHAGARGDWRHSSSPARLG